MVENEFNDGETVENAGIPEEEGIPATQGGIPPGIPQANLSCKLLQTEKTQLEIAARAANKSLSSFIRQTLLDSLKNQPEPQKSSIKTASISEPAPSKISSREAQKAQECYQTLYLRREKLARAPNIDETHSILADLFCEHAFVLRLYKDAITRGAKIE